MIPPISGTRSHLSDSAGDGGRGVDVTENGGPGRKWEAKSVRGSSSREASSVDRTTSHQIFSNLKNTGLGHSILGKDAEVRVLNCRL